MHGTYRAMKIYSGFFTVLINGWYISYRVSREAWFIDDRLIVSIRFFDGSLDGKGRAVDCENCVRAFLLPPLARRTTPRANRLVSSQMNICALPGKRILCFRTWFKMISISRIYIDYSRNGFWIYRILILGFHVCAFVMIDVNFFVNEIIK